MRSPATRRELRRLGQESVEALDDASECASQHDARLVTAHARFLLELRDLQPARVGGCGVARDLRQMGDVLRRMIGCPGHAWTSRASAPGVLGGTCGEWRSCVVHVRFRPRDVPRQSGRRPAADQATSWGRGLSVAVPSRGVACGREARPRLARDGARGTLRAGVRAWLAADAEESSSGAPRKEPSWAPCSPSCRYRSR